MAPVLTDLLPAELAALLAPLGISASESRRIYAHHVQHGRAGFGVRDLAKWKCERAAQAVTLPSIGEASGASRGASRETVSSGMPVMTIVERRRSLLDGFTKYLFRLHDGFLVEAVRIPLFDEKYTVCISSQAGCALGCVFCATGKLGFQRNLSAWEIVEQVRIVRAEADRPVRGVVFMGMGEPLLNYEQVVKAARIFADPSGLAISGRAITISTAGVVPAIRRFTQERLPFRLAVSLTAGTSEKRRRLMPVEETWPIEELIQAVREHAETTRDRVMLEYVAIRGVNCGRDDAARLVELLRGIPVRFNIIEVNDASGEYLPPEADELAAFRDALQALGQPIVRRYSGGKDVRAGCGMLAATGASQ